VSWPSPITIRHSDISRSAVIAAIVNLRLPTLLPARARLVIHPSCMPHTEYNNLPRHRNRRRPSPSTSPSPGIITSPALRTSLSDPAAWRALSFHTSPKNPVALPAQMHHIDILPRFRPSFAITRPAEPDLSSPKRLLTTVGNPAHKRLSL
jgi:hypothetical protein